MAFGKPFERGRSGNPGGRTKEQREREKRLAEAILGLAGPNCESYAERLHEIAMGAIEPKDSIKAIEVLLVRAIGKPTEHLVVDDPTDLTPEQIDEEERLIAIERLQRMTPEEKQRLLAGALTETVQ